MLELASNVRKRAQVRARLRGESGSTMVTVMVVMLILTIGGLTLAAIALNTTTSVTGARDRTAAQAEVDGAIATKTVDLLEGRLTCESAPGTVQNGDSPHAVSWQVTCVDSGTSGTATIRADAIVDGQTAARESVFRYTIEQNSAGGGAGLIFFGNNHVNFYDGSTLGAPEQHVDLVMPRGTLECGNANIYGNAIVYGDVKLNSGCRIHGDLISVTGEITLNGGAEVTGDVSTGGSDENRILGLVGGQLHTSGNIAFPSGGAVKGSVISQGNVSLGDGKVSGTITLPAAKSFSKRSGGSHGGLVQPATVPDPTLRVLPPWFDYDYRASDWPGYTIVTLKDSGKGPGTCKDWNTYGGAGWYTLNSQTAPMVVDARACAELSVNHGSNNPGNTPLAIRYDTVLLANKFDLTNSVFQAASGVDGASKPKLYIVTEDVNANGVADCSNPRGAAKLNGVRIEQTIQAMVYTPCSISMAGGSNPWHGTLYSGKYEQGGTQQFTFECIVLPRMDDCESFTGGEGSEGSVSRKNFELSSSNDVAWSPEL